MENKIRDADVACIFCILTRFSEALLSVVSILQIFVFSVVLCCCDILCVRGFFQ